MRTWQRLIGSALLLTAMTVGAGSAGAGPEPPDPIGAVTVEVMVYGPAFDDIDTQWIPELFVDGADEFDAACPGPPGMSMADGPLFAGRLHECPVYEETTFTLGFPTPPEPYEVTWSCTTGTPIEREAFTDPSATFTISEATPSMWCNVTMSTGMVFVDKLFEADKDAVGIPGPDPVGGADRGDFTLEVYEAGGPLVASGADTSGERCDGFGSVVDGDCLTLLVPPGEYELGEIPAPGYQMADVDCFGVGSPNSVIEAERFPVTDETSFTIGDEPGDSVACTITNVYFEGSVTLTKTITNDDGGTATMGDFTLELYRAGEGTPVASGVCQTNGVCLEGDFPIGYYVVGEVGPDGYTRTVTQSIELGAVEALTDTQAAFTLVPGAEVTVNVASDDDPVAPTTTAAPTTAAPTTAPPTTAGPTTTAIDAGVVTLPSTGSTSNTGQLAALAAMLLVFGAAATALTRRRT
jgi:hypothetical protein